MTICERMFSLIGDQRGKQEELAAFLGIRANHSNYMEEKKY